ncbi:hypothetical protein, partial [Streptomyces sp. DH12]|uniref:hypothetical protein n=1 Tax=Streptomyces sp. DH12 TaxID=2857010 RepID=UPI001E285832
MCADSTARLTDVAFHRPVEVTGAVTLSAAVADGAVTVASDVPHTEARVLVTGSEAAGRIDLA